MLDLFDLPSPASAAAARSPCCASPRASEAPTTTCPVRTSGKRCGKPVVGIDPCRTCTACRAAGAPLSLPWEIANPDTSSNSGQRTRSAA